MLKGLRTRDTFDPYGSLHDILEDRKVSPAIETLKYHSCFSANISQLQMHLQMRVRTEGLYHPALL